MRVRLGACARSPRQPKLPPSPSRSSHSAHGYGAPGHPRTTSIRESAFRPALPHWSPYFLTHLILPRSFKIGGLLTRCVCSESNVRYHRIAFRHSIARRGLGGSLRRTDNSYARNHCHLYDSEVWMPPTWRVVRCLV